MAARTRKIQHDDKTRLKIKTSQIINRLTGHVLGVVEMTSSQVSAGLGLLRKTVPDLSAVNHSGELNLRRASEMSDDELAAIAAARSTRDSEAPIDPSKLN